MRAAVSCLVIFLLAPVPTPDQEGSVAAMLDRYAAGDYDAAVDIGPVHAPTSVLAAFRRRFTRDADAWVARDADHRDGRRLVVASFVLELARAIRRAAPTWTEGEPLVSQSTHDTEQFEEVQRLFEWACEGLRKDPLRQGERTWWLASVHAFGGIPYPRRSSDGLFSDDHAAHALARFPDEPRFQLAAALLGASLAWTMRAASSGVSARSSPGRRDLREGALWPLRNVATAQPEAPLFLGATAIAFAQHDAAGQFLAQAERTTTDSYFLYLAAFLRGRIDELDGRPLDAIAAYRRGVTAVPNAQGATTALAALL